MALSISDNEREHWNQKYREAPGSWLIPDPFLARAFSEYILPLFPHAGSALDLAGGAGRHAIWLAKKGWKVTLIDISETGVEQARQNAQPLASLIHFVVDDLTHFKASQTQLETRFDETRLDETRFDETKFDETKFDETKFDVIMAFFYLEREIFPELLKAIRPGGLLVYKTYTRAQAKLPGGPYNSAHLLEPGELLQLVEPLTVLHYREEVAKKATAELVARRNV